MNLIHIASDEKFINSAYWQFNEVFPNQNFFYLLVNNPEVELKYVSNIDHFQIIPNNLNEIKKLSKSFNENDIICFHGLDYYRSVFLNALPDKCKIVWFLWGMEVYNNRALFKNKSVLGPVTSTLFSLDSYKDIIVQFVKDRFRQIYYKIKFKTNSPQLEAIKAMKRADYLGILFQEEFNFVKSIVKNHAKFLRFSYYPIELMVKDEGKRINSNQILIGNSASETNNHLEIFEILRTMTLNDKDLIVPLSYGDVAYRDIIIEKGTDIFGKNFHPLIDFMPLHEYNKFLEKCGIVIMNHYRQQAVGNVLTMLWMGAKIFLDERNTIYQYLKRIGIKVFSVQTDLNKNNSTVFNLLSHEEQNANRIILKGEVGKRFLLKELKEQFKSIKDDH
ncbi:TDP-N-acetylfucosamine:lipid II N-acetylfucosaminyltransferase [Cyclobacterium amurskyense]|uniref:4-alpha-L-fucosyltransferase n=1 Tax=Cyclobacterium amurskyense TaxID=320787 RepID=A0A0H4PVL3_9BACT|nr:TDP-N-acetylfucosamine:lipid II N-acetylfucosaminyltransferase [Cyclobacterium amurskyense]AKP52432.1 hypothetical protein CA2015_3030 [Cyclobacterium amurskyense]